MIDRKGESQELRETVSDLKEEISDMKNEIDILEQYSRRDNLRLFGVPHTHDREDYDMCVIAVIEALNSVGGQKTWSPGDIIRAHRVGQAREGQPRPMIVRFSRWRDKMSLLTDRGRRDQLYERGIRLANDLTRSQAHMVAAARRDGKRAYFKRGRMMISPAPPDPRSYAQVVATGTKTMTSTAGREDHGHYTPSDTGSTRRVLSPSQQKGQGQHSGAADQTTIPMCGVNTTPVVHGSQQKRSEVTGGGGGVHTLASSSQEEQCLAVGGGEGGDASVSTSRGVYHSVFSGGGEGAVSGAGGPTAQRCVASDVSGKPPRVARQSTGGQRGAVRGGGNSSRRDVSASGARGGRRGTMGGRQTELNTHWGNPGSNTDRHTRSMSK